IGEGASGGALGIGIGDRVLMMENSWYSVISPENCSTILWRSWEFKEKAATALKLTSDDMMKNKLIDGVIKEPLGGAHTFPDQSFKNVKKAIKESIAQCETLTSKKLVKIRMDKFSEMGVYSE
ncbi:MAG: acetyl-CoA carboxylase carboxyl transferase subunit alpha, partial [Flavobacteriales bacterium]|nr:acetyl-CoA carboxylase carboxyl transferase subunit alpha [Flavobacteriales bacterium]